MAGEAKRRGKTSGKSGRAPRVTAVVDAAVPESERAIKGAVAGTTLRVEGSGFGADPSAATVLFDETAAPPLHVGYTDRYFLVAAPFVQGPTSTLRVRVGKRSSESHVFKVTPPRRTKLPLGAQTRDALAAIDEALTIAVAAGRRVDAVPELGDALLQSANTLDASRKAVLGLAHGLLRTAEAGDAQAMRTVRAMDRALLESRTIPLIRSLSAAGAAAFAFGQGLGNPEPVFGEIFGIDLGTGLDWGGFTAHEIAKLLDSLGLALSADPEPAGKALAALVRALGKFLDVFAQLAQKGGAALKSEAQKQKLEAMAQALADANAKLDQQAADLAKMEQKADQHGAALADQSTYIATVDGKVDQQITAVAQLEQKSDTQATVLDDLTATLARVEDKADRGEQKLDQLESKLDLQEEKLDRHEEKLDRVEEKADRHEEKLDRLEEKADRHEEKLDRLEEKADREEQKLDLQEQKLDHLDEQLHDVRQKVDRLEEKSDRQEEKLDREELKLDRVEEKLDREELKLDRIEEKLDREEEKIDRLVLVPPPHEGSIAAQRAGGARVTAAAVALGATDNLVYMRAAIDADRADLDNLTSWSPWVSFGRPTPSAILLVSVSLDLQYEEGSNTRLMAMLSVRDGQGIVYYRTYNGASHAGLLDVAQWSAWLDVLGQP